MHNREKNLNAPEAQLTDLLSAIWKGKLVILISCLLFSVVAVVIALNKKDIYSSEALLAPVSSDKGVRGGGLTSQIGGIAALAGFDLNSSKSIDNAQMALAILKSRQFLTNFIGKHKLLPDILAVSHWDKLQNKVNYNLDVYNPETSEWAVEYLNPATNQPSLQKAYSEFLKILNVFKDKDTGLVTIIVEHQSPYIAKRLVDLLIQEINQTMKERDTQEAKASLNFLNAQLKETKISDSKIVLFNLVEEQTKTIMFSNARKEYVFKTIDPAIVSEKKIRPSRTVICILGGVLGIMFGIFLVIVSFFRQFKSDSLA